MKVKVKVKVTAQSARKDERGKTEDARRRNGWALPGISMPSPEQETPDFEPQPVAIIHQLTETAYTKYLPYSVPEVGIIPGGSLAAFSATLIHLLRRSFGVPILRVWWPPMMN